MIKIWTTTSQATSKRRENQIELQEVNFKRKIQARDGELDGDGEMEYLCLAK